jgi:hypothetical protein
MIQSNKPRPIATSNVVRDGTRKSAEGSNLWNYRSLLLLRRISDPCARLYD